MRKNAGMAQAIKIVYKYKCHCLSEVYDKCSPEEFAELMYANINYKNVLQPSLDLYRKDMLAIQRKNRWDYMMSHAKYDRDQELEYLKIFQIQNVCPIDFTRKLKSVLLREHEKIGSIKIYGVKDSCKSIITLGICHCFLCAYQTNHNSEGEFYHENMVNQTVNSLEELYATKVMCETLKCILSGAPIDVSKKNWPKQLLSDTPNIISSNYALFGRGHLPPRDEGALAVRCYSFLFSVPYKPACHLTPSALYHFFWLCDNQEML